MARCNIINGATREVDKKMIFLSPGEKLASGDIGNWKRFGVMVSYLKGRKLSVDIAQKLYRRKQAFAACGDVRYGSKFQGNHIGSESIEYGYPHI